MALALFASFVAPEALCTDRRTGMLDLYLAGPLDVKRYLAAKWAAVGGVMLMMTVGPQLFLLVAYTVVSAGPSLGDAPLLLLRIVVSGIGVALFYTAVAMGSLEPHDAQGGRRRRDRARPARALDRRRRRGREQRRARRARAPHPAVATEYAWRVFGETRSPPDDSPDRTRLDRARRRRAGRLDRLLGAAVCLVSYRRQGARR